MVCIGSLLDVVLNSLLRWYHCFVLVYFLLTLSWLGDPSKVLCLGKLIVVLLFVLWVIFIEFGKYFASSFRCTHLLVCFVASVHLFASHHRFGEVNFRSGNSLVQPSKASNIFLLSFLSFPLTLKHFSNLK